MLPRPFPPWTLMEGTMARQTLKERQSLAERRAAHAAQNQTALDVEAKALAKAHDFASLTPAEKAAQTDAESREAKAAHAKAQVKAVEENKALAGPAENKAADGGDLDSVDFASASAKAA